MTYVITDLCVGTKDAACLSVCPVDCIHPTPDEPDYEEVMQLYIDPDECIDCDACAIACPVDAPCADDRVPRGKEDAVEANRRYFQEDNRVISGRQ